jgi:peptidoglycan/LPS O-acetylase OafA/YrhL
VANATERHLPLDWLRAAAVLLVIGRHLEPAQDTPLFLSGLFRIWRRGGWVGVDLFFVLSGFLIAGLLFRAYRQHGTLAVGRFYLRRGLKIYPAFYLFLTLTLPLAAHLGVPPTTTSASVLSECFFLQSYLPGAWNHTWSLAVEEHFYLLLPLLLTALRGRAPASADPFRALGKLYVALALALLALRVATALGRDFLAPVHLFPTHLRLDALGLGVVLAYYHCFHSAAFRHILSPYRYLLIGAGAALLAPAFVFRLEATPWLYTLGLSLFAWASAALLCGLLLLEPSAGPVSRSFALVGAHSYSIYLWHMPVILWGPTLFERWVGVHLGGLGACAWALAGSIGVGVLMARLVEQPVLRWRERRFPAQEALREPTGPIRTLACGGDLI